MSFNFSPSLRASHRGRAGQRDVPETNPLVIQWQSADCLGRFTPSQWRRSGGKRKRAAREPTLQWEL